MRRGQNPAKFVEGVTRPARITVAVLTYAPFLSGFFAEALGVIQACLTSLWETTPQPYDLLVFDNGSCPEVVEFLTSAHGRGKIQFLVLSERNLGKGGAWNFILKAAPGEVVAYTDCDARFFPGWLERSMEILDTFPRVGMVTARPFRTPDPFLTATVSWAESEPEATLQRGRFIPWETFREFDMSLGQDEAAIRSRYETTDDIRVTYRGVQAQVGASHYQFVGYKNVLESFVPFAMDRPMGQVRQLDERINAAGYLRLMTVDPLMMNMSNSVEPVPAASPDTQVATPRRSTRIADWGPLRRALLKVYDAIFRLYFDRRGAG